MCWDYAMWVFPTNVWDDNPLFVCQPLEILAMESDWRFKRRFQVILCLHESWLVEAWMELKRVVSASYFNRNIWQFYIKMKDLNACFSVTLIGTLQSRCGPLWDPGERKSLTHSTRCFCLSYWLYNTIFSSSFCLVCMFHNICRQPFLLLPTSLLISTYWFRKQWKTNTLHFEPEHPSRLQDYEHMV